MTMIAESDSAECSLSIVEILDLSEREWLVTKLEHETGILLVEFSQVDPHRLRVIYALSAFSVATLVDAIQQYHLTAKVLTSNDMGAGRKES